MANEINIYEPRYLAEAVRTAPPIRTFLRDRFFSNVKTFSTERVDIDIVKGNRKMAAFVHPMVGGEIVQNEGYETKSYAPPLINPATVTTADKAAYIQLKSGFNKGEKSGAKPYINILLENLGKHCFHKVYKV